MNSNKKIAATFYSLGTYCVRNISKNTLNKGDYYYYYYYSNINKTDLILSCVPPYFLIVM